LILTNIRNLGLARESARESVYVITIDALDSGRSTKNPGLAISPAPLAYIIYTSGSTGQPKGVCDNHRNVLHHIMRVTNDFRVCAEDRQTLLRSYSFSGAVRDIFSALLNGASLHVFDLTEEGMAQLSPWVIAEEITIYRSVISVFR
jgi:surfactin family lipopeptide synthetase A